MGDRKLVDGTWAQELDQPVEFAEKGMGLIQAKRRM